MGGCATLALGVAALGASLAASSLVLLVASSSSATASALLASITGK